MSLRETIKQSTRSVRKAWRYRTRGYRCLPDFLIIGAQKAGTTSLYHLLGRHPGVRPSVGSKETHFFDDKYGLGLEWYRAQFPIERKGRRTFEATPYYLFHPLAPCRAAATQPDLRLVAIVRNPVDRAYSHYQHQVRQGREPLSFEDALAAEADRIEQESRDLAAGRIERGRNHRRFSYLARGRYAEQIERWLAHFSAAQLHVLSVEALVDAPEPTLAQLQTFLGLPVRELRRGRRYNAGRYRDRMAPETRASLEDYFAPHNERLYELLGQRFDWPTAGAGRNDRT